MGPGMGAVVAALVATVVMSGLPGMEGGWGGIIPRPRSRSRLFPAAIAPLAAALAAFSQPSYLVEETSQSVLNNKTNAHGEVNFVKEWDSSQVVTMLQERLGDWVTQYSSMFHLLNVSGEVLLQLSEADLQEWLGVNVDAHRKLLLNLQSQLRPREKGGRLWAACVANRRECHILLQGMRFFPRATGVYIHLTEPGLLAMVVGGGWVRCASFALCYAMQPHFTLLLLLIPHWPDHWFLQCCLFNMGLTTIMTSAHAFYQPISSQQVFQRSLREQFVFLLLGAYWAMFEHVPWVVSDFVFYLTLGDELLRVSLGMLLLCMSTGLGLFIFLLGMKRGVSVDEFVRRLYLLFATRWDTQRWPPALDIPEWIQDIAMSEGADVPAQFICPISKGVMALPTIVCTSGLSYDYEPITQWVNERLVEPQTRDTVTVSELAPNRALYSEISEWLQYVKETYNANQRWERSVAEGRTNPSNQETNVGRMTWLQWAIGPDVSDSEGDEDYFPNHVNSLDESEDDELMQPYFLEHGEAMALVEGHMWACGGR